MWIFFMKNTSDFHRAAKVVVFTIVLPEINIFSPQVKFLKTYFVAIKHVLNTVIVKMSKEE